MIPDAYGKSRVCNLYFDTPDFRIIRRSLEYTLELNYEQTSQSHIEIDVKSKATAKLNLKEQ